MKHMMKGKGAENCNKTPIPVSGGEREGNDEFQYFSSSRAASGMMVADVERINAKVSRGLYDIDEN